MDEIDKERARREAGERRPLTQSQHAAVNARYPGTTLEMCIECGEATGKAGRGEDSLYCGVCDEGPYCSAHFCDCGTCASCCKVVEHWR